MALALDTEYSSSKIAVIWQISYSTGSYYYLNCNDGNAWEYTVLSNTVTLPAPPSEYASAQVNYYIDGRVDDYFRCYLNNVLQKEAGFGWNSSWGVGSQCSNPEAKLNRGQISFTADLSLQTNVVRLAAYSGYYPTAAIVYSSRITIKTISK